MGWPSGTHLQIVKYCLRVCQCQCQGLGLCFFVSVNSTAPHSDGGLCLCKSEEVDSGYYSGFIKVDASRGRPVKIH